MTGPGARGAVRVDPTPDDKANRCELRVLGTVVRVAGREVALKLLAGVPLRVVLDEQRFLRDWHRGTVR